MNIQVLFQKKYITICLILIVTLSVFYPVLSGKMISLDDTKLIMGLNNPGNNKKFSIKNIFFKKAINHYYRPLLELSFIADSKVWLMEASGYHLTNYILHALIV